MTLALTVLTLLFAVLVLLPLWRHPHWLVRGLDFPRLQLAVLGAGLLAAQLFLLPVGWPMAGAVAVTLTCLVWLLWWLLPYTPIWPVEVPATDGGRQISILTANVLQSNRNAAALIALVREHRPDVLIALETDQWWEGELDALLEEMPHAVKHPRDNLYGMHLYSRLPVLAHDIEFLVEKDVPSLHAVIALPGIEGTDENREAESIRFHFLHPAPPSPTENPESAERDAELIIVARSIAERRKSGDDGPTVVTGDLNDVAWSQTTRLFRKISGLLDPRIGRGMFNTFHADYPLLRWPLDHLFHSRHFTLNSINRLPHFGSDHLPLLTCLTLAPTADRAGRRSGAGQGLTAATEDRQLADDIAAEQGVSHRDVPKPEG